MENSQKGSVLTGALVVLVIVLAVGVLYLVFFKKPQMQYEQIPIPVQSSSTSTMPITEQQNSQPADSSVQGQKVQTTIYVPKNQSAYDQLVVNDQAGDKPGTASLTSNDFVAQNVTVTTTPTYGIEQATADAAAATVKSQTIIKTIGFKVVNNTAYIILNIDVDGWAGVSYSMDSVEHIIKQTLLHFPDIKNVDIGSNAAFQVTGVPAP